MENKGAASGKSSSVNNGPDYITEDDWWAWAADPWSYQSALNGEEIV